jgi:tetratricopeptide (TPR) repeat protein
MKRQWLVFLIVCVVLVPAAIAARAQVANVSIAAGTPEDKDLQAITAESDGQKRITMLQDFLQKYSANPQAVIYGQWQLAQQYLELGDTAKALEYGQKAVAGQPNNLDILVFVAGAAQKAKATDVVMDCAEKGGKAFNGIANQGKPEGMDAEAFALRVKQDQDRVRQNYEYLEASALNAMVAEPNAKKRMGYIERFFVAFPGSRFQDQATELAINTLGELKDSARMASFTEKALAANPNSLSLLVVLSDAYGRSSDFASGPRAEGYARKALELAKTQTPTSENRLGLYVGLAHSALGYALLKQDKNLPAIAELKTACEQLKSYSEAYPGALYTLGYAYAKTGKLQDAKVVLTELVAIGGPTQQPARDLLAKVQAGPPKTAPKRAK